MRIKQKGKILKINHKAINKAKFPRSTHIFFEKILMLTVDFLKTFQQALIPIKNHGIDKTNKAENGVKLILKNSRCANSLFKISLEKSGYKKRTQKNQGKAKIAHNKKEHKIHKLFFKLKNN